LRPRIVAVVGPTAVGKTDLGIDLARRFGGEIISADSMQVYRGMDIGTAKPEPAELKEAPHHLIDVASPDEEFSAGRFKRLAREAVRDIRGRGALPLVVGGTALYVRVLLYDYPLAEVPRDERLRSRLQERAREEGRHSLHGDLQRTDPDSARRIHPNDLKRVIRALEVYRITGRTMTRWRRETPRESVYDVLKLGVWIPREELYRRIDRRVDVMVDRGLIEEVRGLLQRFGDLSPTARQALGYREVIQYLRGEIDRAVCIEQIKKNTRNFAKSQLTWFRKDEDIFWIDPRCGGKKTARVRVRRWLHTSSE